MCAFPPGRRGVLLPADDRRTAAAGVALYTASRKWVVRAQVAAFWFVRWFGTGLLPGRQASWEPPCPSGQWAELVQQWEKTLGPLTGFSAYERRQAARTGLTFVATREGRGVAVIKLRDNPTSLEREQAALVVIEEQQPRSFRSPRSLGSGNVGEYFWAAQECVFTRPHHAAFDAPDGLFSEISSIVAQVTPPPSPAAGVGELVASHGDLTPWNLRVDHRGVLWLFDWEDLGWGPEDGDRTYFCVTSAALGGPAVSGDHSPVAVDYWRSALHRRSEQNPEDVRFGEKVLTQLTAADLLRSALRR